MKPLNGNFCSCGKPMVVHCIIPSEAWEKIADGDYMLCVECIDERLAAQGLRVEGIPVYRSKGLTFGPGHACWRLLPEITDAKQGNPHFYSSAPFWRDR